MNFPEGNILSYLDQKKPLFGVPYAFCRWYDENPKYQTIPGFKGIYEQMSLLNTRF